MQDLIHISTECQHHNINYVLDIKVLDSVLYIELEQKFDTNFSLWKNSFSYQYIEDLTLKTGRPKKFKEFIEILTTVLQQPKSINMQIDILTFQDLEVMRAKKNGQEIQQNASQKIINKRYLILSSLSYEEQIHYPLSLNFEQIDDPEKIKNSINKIRQQIIEIKQQSHEVSIQLQAQSPKSDIYRKTESQHNQKDSFQLQSTSSLNNTLQNDKLQNENELLRTKVKRMEETQINKKSFFEMEKIIKNKEEIENKYEQLKKYSSNELDRIKTMIQQKDDELLQKTIELFELKKTASQSWEIDEAGKRLRQFVLKQSEENYKEIQNQKKNILTQLQGIDNINFEIENLKKQDLKAKNRLKQLQIEIDAAQLKGSSQRNHNIFKNNTPSSTPKRSNSVPGKPVYSPQVRPQYGKNNVQQNIKAPVSSKLPIKGQVSPSNYGPKKVATTLQENLNRIQRNAKSVNIYQKPQPTSQQRSPNLFQKQVQQNNNKFNQKPQIQSQQIQKKDQQKPQIHGNSPDVFKNNAKIVNNYQPNNFQRQTYQQKNQSATTNKQTYQQRIQSPTKIKQDYQQKNQSPTTRYNNHTSQNLKNKQQKQLPQKQQQQRIDLKNNSLDERLNKLESILNKIKN